MKSSIVRAVLVLVALICGVAKAQAAPLLFTLSGVVFADNAVAAGSFVFDPATDTFGSFDITTTQGVVNDTYTGSEYSFAAGTGTNFASPPDAFIFDNFSYGLKDNHYLALAVNTHITGAGSYALVPGNSSGPGGFGNSGEFVDSNLDVRLITGGTLIVAPVPEPSVALLFLVGGGALLGRKRLRSVRRRN